LSLVLYILFHRSLWGNQIVHIETFPLLIRFLTWPFKVELLCHKSAGRCLYLRRWAAAATGDAVSLFEFFLYHHRGVIIKFNTFGGVRAWERQDGRHSDRGDPKVGKSGEDRFTTSLLLVHGIFEELDGFTHSTLGNA
jgi:hypothetical protein